MKSPFHRAALHDFTIENLLVLAFVKNGYKGIGGLDVTVFVWVQGGVRGQFSREMFVITFYRPDIF